jgi:xylulokinase
MRNRAKTQFARTRSCTRRSARLRERFVSRAVTALVGLDVGTTGVKAVAIDPDGAVLATAEHGYPLSTPQPGWSEQDPEDWWRASEAALAEVSAGREVSGIGLSGQMHGLVVLDGEDRVLRPAILWNDQRTGAECDEIRARMGGREALVKATGNDALTGFTAPKILWVRKHEPEVYARVDTILLPKDYVRLRLTGNTSMDKADGSGTLLFDLPTRDWSRPVLEKLDIPIGWLPGTSEGPEIPGTVNAEAAAATGLMPGTPVMAGGGDQAAGAVGAGAVEPGIVSLTLGTSGVIFASTKEPLYEPQGRLHAFCHAVPGLWHFMGVTLSAAGSLQWYRDTLAPGEGFDTLTAEAAAVPPGSEGLLFLPYLSGERTPYPDPAARGAFVGLTLRHGRGHLTRAVLEGVAFSMRDCFGLLKSAGLSPVREVRVAGGGAKSQLWRQICASALGVELVTVNSTEGAAYGAALLAAVGAGTFPDVPAACAAALSSTGRTPPEPAWAEAYERAHREYRALYPALKPGFDRQA